MQVNNDTLIALAKSLDSVAYALHNFCVKTLEALDAPPATATTATTSQVETPSPAETSLTEAPAQPNEKPLTLVDVRKVAAEKTRQGHTEAIRTLLETYGVSKLSEVDPSDYVLLKQELEALGNG